MTLLKEVRKHPSIISDEDEVRTERYIPVVLNELLSIGFNYFISIGSYHIICA